MKDRCYECRKRDYVKAKRKRCLLWIKAAEEAIYKAKRCIREDRPLSTIAEVNIARLELLKVKQTNVREIVWRKKNAGIYTI